MKKSFVLSSILTLAGLVALFVGTSILFFPVEFYTPYGILIDGNRNLLNELKAAGGAILFSGGFILTGAFVPRMARSATALSLLIFLVFGASRVISFLLDGLPDQELLLVTASELVIGLLTLWAFLRYRVRE